MSRFYTLKLLLADAMSVLKVEPGDEILYRFLYMTNANERVTGCSNRFSIRPTTSSSASSPLTDVMKPMASCDIGQSFDVWVSKFNLIVAFQVDYS